MLEGVSLTPPAYAEYVEYAEGDVHNTAPLHAAASAIPLATHVLVAGQGRISGGADDNGTARSSHSRGDMPGSASTVCYVWLQTSECVGLRRPAWACVDREAV
jgi:hypothetical protein